MLKRLFTAGSKAFWHTDSSIVSCQIRINDETGASRSKQPLERAHGQHWRSPLMVFWCQYKDIVYPQCLLVDSIQQNLSAIFSERIYWSLRKCWTFQMFEITVGKFSKCKFGGEICNKKVIDWIWRNMPALGLWAEADLASSVCCTAQRPRVGIFRHIQSITYKKISSNICRYLLLN